MIDPGELRSDSANHGAPTSGTVGPHQGKGTGTAMREGLARAAAPHREYVAVLAAVQRRDDQDRRTLRRLAQFVEQVRQGGFVLGAIEPPQGVLELAYMAALPAGSTLKKPLDRALIEITGSEEWRRIEESYFGR